MMCVKRMIKWLAYPSVLTGLVELNDTEMPKKGKENYPRVEKVTKIMYIADI